MAETLQELFQEFVNYSHQERVQKAGEAGRYIVGVLKENDYSEEDCVNFLVYVTALFANADGEVAEEEHALFRDITGFDVSLAQFRDILRGFNNEAFVADMDKMIDNLPDGIRNAICYYGLAFLSADDALTVEEQKLFVRILQK